MKITKRAVLTLVDPSTGEALADGQFVYQQRQPARFKETYIVAFQHGMALLAQSDLTANDHKTLLALLARLTLNNHVLIAQKEIAEATGIRPNNISRSINRLMERQIISKGPKFGHSNSYKLNPDYVWFGKADQRARERQRQATDVAKQLLTIVRNTNN